MPNPSRYCCILNCGSKSSYSGPKKRTMFQVPTDFKRREKWLKALSPHLRKGKRSRRKLYVCDSHFKSEDVLRNYILLYDNGTTENIPRDNIRLRKTSVPSIFNDGNVSKRLEKDLVPFVNKESSLHTASNGSEQDPLEIETCNNRSLSFDNLSQRNVETEAVNEAGNGSEQDPQELEICYNRSLSSDNLLERDVKMEAVNEACNESEQDPQEFEICFNRSLSSDNLLERDVKIEAVNEACNESEQDPLKLEICCNRSLSPDNLLETNVKMEGNLEHFNSVNEVCSESEQDPLESGICFDDVFTNLNKIELPNSSWCRNFCEELYLLVWTKIIVNVHRDGKSLETNNIQVKLYKSLDYQIAFNSKDISFSNQPSSPQKFTDINHILNYANNLKICTGGPKLSYYKTKNISCAYLVDGKWKHINCQILSEMDKMCRKCFSLFDIFDKHRSRREKGAPVRLRGKSQFQQSAITKKAVLRQTASVDELQNRIKLLQDGLEQTKKRLGI